MSNKKGPGRPKGKQPVTVRSQFAKTIKLFVFMQKLLNYLENLKKKDYNRSDDLISPPRKNPWMDVFESFINVIWVLLNFG